MLASFESKSIGGELVSPEGIEPSTYRLRERLPVARRLKNASAAKTDCNRPASHLRHEPLPLGNYVGSVCEEMRDSSDLDAARRTPRTRVAAPSVDFEPRGPKSRLPPMLAESPNVLQPAGRHCNFSPNPDCARWLRKSGESPTLCADNCSLPDTGRAAAEQRCRSMSIGPGILGLCPAAMSPDRLCPDDALRRTRCEQRAGRTRSRRPLHRASSGGVAFACQYEDGAGKCGQEDPRRGRPPRERPRATTIGWSSPIALNRTHRDPAAGPSSPTLHVCPVPGPLSS